MVESKIPGNEEDLFANYLPLINKLKDPQLIGWFKSAIEFERIISKNKITSLTNINKKEIISLGKQIEEAKKEIKQRDQELQKRDRELQKRDQELQQRDEELQQRDEELKLRDQELKLRDEELKLRDQEIVKLQEDLNEEKNKNYLNSFVFKIKFSDLPINENNLEISTILPKEESNQLSDNVVK